MPDLLTTAEFPHGYAFQLEAVIPNDVSAFELEMTILGEDFRAEIIKIGFVVIPSEQPRGGR